MNTKLTKSKKKPYVFFFVHFVFFVAIVRWP
jgi:hypothetical protein